MIKLWIQFNNKIFLMKHKLKNKYFINIWIKTKFWIKFFYMNFQIEWYLFASWVHSVSTTTKIAIKESPIFSGTNQMMGMIGTILLVSILNKVNNNGYSVEEVGTVLRMAKIHNEASNDKWSIGWQWISPITEQIKSQGYN